MMKSKSFVVLFVQLAIGSLSCAGPCPPNHQACIHAVALNDACNAGNLKACVAGADTQFNMIGIRNREAFLVRACELGDLESCYGAAQSLAPSYQLEYGERISRGSRQEEATPLYLRLCEGGRASACGSAARLVSAIDLHKARALLARGCELGARDACYELGMALVSGALGPVDEDAAGGYLRAACEGARDARKKWVEKQCEHVLFLRSVGIGSSTPQDEPPQTVPRCDEDEREVACRFDRSLAERTPGIQKIRGLLVTTGHFPTVIYAGARDLAVGTVVKIRSFSSGSIGSSIVVEGPIVAMSPHRLRIADRGPNMKFNYEADTWVVIEAPQGH